MIFSPWSTRLSACLAVLLVTACASSPPVRYFALETPADPGRHDEDQERVVVVGPIVLPDYLRRSQLVSRGRGAALVVDDINRWAEPLEEAVPRVLASHLNAAGDGYTATPMPAYGIDADVRLTATVLRFEADSSGTVELLVQWSLDRTDTAGPTRLRTDRYQTRTAAGDPEAITTAMGELLSRFADAAAAALRTD
jgi:uncharacterized lipoprotein YmbA